MAVLTPIGAFIKRILIVGKDALMSDSVNRALDDIRNAITSAINQINADLVIISTGLPPGSGGTSTNGSLVHGSIGVIDFGAFPGASDASLAVTGQTTITSAAMVDAWLVSVDSADHSADEHTVETIHVSAGNVVSGAGFTIYAVNNGLPDTLIYGKWNLVWSWM